MKMYLSYAVALSAITAGTASAEVTVFEKDNFSYSVSADLQIQLLQESGIDEDIDVNFDDGEIKNHFEYKLNDSLVGFGQLDFDVAQDDEVAREEAYIGLASGGLSFWVGASDYVTDAFGVERSIDVGDVAGDAFLLDNSDDLIGFGYETDLYTIKLSHDLEVEDDATSTDVFLESGFAGFSVALALQTASNIVLDTGNGGTLLTDADTYGISVAYDLADYGVALAYSSVDIDEAPDTINNLNVTGSAKVLPTTTVSLGFETVDVGGDANEALLGINDSDSWYLNAVYQFPDASNFSTFAEVGQTDVDGVDDIDAGFLAGLRLVF